MIVSLLCSRMFPARMRTITLRFGKEVVLGYPTFLSLGGWISGQWSVIHFHLSQGYVLVLLICVFSSLFPDTGIDKRDLLNNSAREGISEPVSIALSQ